VKHLDLPDYGGEAVCVLAWCGKASAESAVRIAGVVVSSPTRGVRSHLMVVWGTTRHASRRWSKQSLDRSAPDYGVSRWYKDLDSPGGTLLAPPTRFPAEGWALWEDVVKMLEASVLD
jgi:hypothetical protein